MATIGNRRESLSRFLIYASLTLSGLALAAWITGNHPLVPIIPVLSPMRANAAFCFILLSIALLNVRKPDGLRLTKFLASIVLLIALLTAIEIIFGLNFGIDQILAKDTLRIVANERPGQMSLLAALCLALFSIGILSIRTLYYFVGQTAALITLVIGISISFSYPFSIAIEGRVSSVTGMALHTALLVVALSSVILLELPYSQWLSLFLSTDLLGRRGRQTLGVAILLPLVGGWFILYTTQRQLIDPSLGEGIYVGIFMLVLIVMLTFFGSAASRDPLTRLYNRGFLEQSLSQSLSRYQRYGEKGAVLFIDLDGFKNVNDKLGHTAGDSLLQEIAHQITPTLRSTDVFARSGGDEFVILLPNIKAGAAALVAKRILNLLAVIQPGGNADVRISASIGIALFPQDGTDADLLVRLADNAMYLAKSTGRSRIVNASKLRRKSIKANTRN